MTDSNKFIKYDPQHPLPEGIQKMERDETVCRYCGVSYLIHSEIKALENKLKQVEKELENYKGCEQREAELRSKLENLQMEHGTLQKTMREKDQELSDMTKKLRVSDEDNAKLKSSNGDITVKLAASETSASSLKSRFKENHRKISLLAITVQQQKNVLQSIHKFVNEKKEQSSDELQVMLSSMRIACSAKDAASKELQNRVVLLENESKELAIKLDESRQNSKLNQNSLNELKKLQTECAMISNNCDCLEKENAGLKAQHEVFVLKSRSIASEADQLRDQLRKKSQEFEDILQKMRSKDKTSESSIHNLQSKLQEKATELGAAKHELQALTNEYREHKKTEEETHRKASVSLNESMELKSELSRLQRDLQALKDEREMMITEHQNRIEQLRESFKQKMAESDKWPKKHEHGLKIEREKHGKEMKALEASLKESFVMELEIERQKYRTLMEKYKNGSKDVEEKYKSELSSIEIRHHAELKDAQNLMADVKSRSAQSEHSLQMEITNLKNIIRDLENRLGHLNSGNEELLSQTKTELHDSEIHIENLQLELRSIEDQLNHSKEEVQFLQETVHKECEERFELAESLSEAREELLQLKRPSGGYSSAASSTNYRRESLLMNPLDEIRHSSTGGSTYTPHPPSQSPPREVTSSSAITVGFAGDVPKSPGKLKGSSIIDTRRRIATMLGKK